MSRRPQRSRPRLIPLAIACWLPLAAALVLILQAETLPLGREVFVKSVIGYAATILAFAGGARFGFNAATSTDRPGIERLAPAVALVGMVALVLPVPVALAVLVVGFAAAGALDALSAFRGRLPQDYARARSVMTWLFALTLMAILVLLETL